MMDRPRLDALIAKGISRMSEDCVISGETLWSRSQLQAAIAEISVALKDKGLEPGDIVGVRMERGAELVAALCGVLMAGGVYLPLDPNYPQARLDYMREDSGAMFEVTAGGVENLPTGRRRHGTDDLAYLIYTSGSTGRPKGVAVTHTNVENFLRSMREEPGLTEQDTLLAVTTPSFDISVLEIFGPLTAGARLVIATEEEVRNGERLSALIARHGVTIMQATPSTWRLMLDAGWQGAPGLKALCGGEELPAPLADQLLAHTGELWNMYGPTETTVWSACAKITRSEDIPLGRAIAATDLRILNEDGSDLPQGEVGEIVIGGAGVTDGYWQRPELNAEKFFTDEMGRRFFRTGDAGLIDNDGRLRFRGRLDRQVKLRGHRIEPEEIERVLKSLPGVQDAAVTVVMEEGAASALIAHLAPKLDLDAMKELAAAQLPAIMVPSQMIGYDALPRLPNGKIDRNTLSIVTAEAAASPSPMTPTEAIIAEVFSGLLKQEVTDTSKHFFELGGHSLLAARALAQLRAKTGTSLPLTFIFEAESITDLAERIDGLTPTEEFEF
ncbi:non-ribosomal peptide synthetase [Parvularcula marina]|nr:amino acid adenylation domain-containing protein [Parvularcula marina]